MEKLHKALKIKTCPEARYHSVLDDVTGGTRLLIPSHVSIYIYNISVSAESVPYMENHRLIGINEIHAIVSHACMGVRGNLIYKDQGHQSTEGVSKREIQRGCHHPQRIFYFRFRIRFRMQFQLIQDQHTGSNKCKNCLVQLLNHSHVEYT